MKARRRAGVEGVKELAEEETEEEMKEVRKE